MLESRGARRGYRSKRHVLLCMYRYLPKFRYMYHDRQPATTFTYLIDRQVCNLYRRYRYSIYMNGAVEGAVAGCMYMCGAVADPVAGRLHVPSYSMLSMDN